MIARGRIATVLVDDIPPARQGKFAKRTRFIYIMTIKRFQIIVSFLYDASKKIVFRTTLF